MTPTPELLLRDAAWLRGLARRLAAPVDQADDLVQEVSLAALQSGARPIGRPWLAAVAVNLSRLFHRRSLRERQRLLRLAIPAASPSAAELVEQAELQQRAVTAVLELPALQRDVVLMRFLQGLSLEDTAQRLQLPLETVRTRQRRALAALRERLLPADERHGMAGLWLIGWIMNTKAAATIAAAIALAAGAFWMMREPPPPATSESAMLVPEPAALVEEPASGSNAETHGLRTAAAPEREAAPTPAAAPEPAPSATTTTLAVAVRWSDDGTPATGVHVMCRPMTGLGPILASDAAGMATFAGLDAGRYCISSAHMNPGGDVFVDLGAPPPGARELHTGRLRTLVGDAKTGAAKTIEVRVARGFAVQGRVVDPDGAPVPFADLVVSQGGVDPAFAFPAGRADAQGRFRVDGMGTMRMLGAQHPQFGSTDFELMKEDSGQHELVLTMPRKGVAAVAGRVVDGNGKPLARAFVHLQQTGTVKIQAGARCVMPPPPIMTTTEADGRFSAATLRPGKRRLYVYVDGLAPHFSTFELAEGERREVDVQLLPGATLVCTVRDAQGQPIDGATVSLAGLSFPQQAWQTSHGGKPLRFTGMPPGPRKVVVNQQKFAAFEREVVFPATGELVLDVELRTGHTVKGRVLDHQGKPLAKWWVDLGYGRRRVTTDDEGRFTLPDAAETGNSVYVRPTMGFVPFRLRVEGVAADEGERTFVVTADCAPSARVRGRCLAIDGTPLGGVALGLWQEHMQVEGNRVTAADGSFEIGPLPPGAYRIYPTHRDAKFEGVDFELKADEVRELPPFASKVPKER
ncbi:MAG TPA: sigma-70 family RNA polymerase sigma factor [Planctomycetota bacterium]|nr:sigma-70 family RNA polymerase sigma factor [Planctomycetota bacterium]